MADFHEIQLSTKISYGATGGPRRKTEIIELYSGFEERNSPWSQSRRSYNIGYGIRDTDDVYDIMEFFEAREASLYGFRYKDWSDYKSTKPLLENIVAATDQVIGVGTGAEILLQLIKTNPDTHNTIVREITKPIASSVIIAVDGITIDPVNYYVSEVSGRVTFGYLISAGQIITAGFEFDVPVRFAQEELRINLANYEKGEIPDIALVEVRTTPPSAESEESLQEAALWKWLQAVDINTAVNVHWDSTWGTL